MRSKMFSGPIMPRITECLAQRQEVAPEEVEEVKFIKTLNGKVKVQPKGWERRKKILLIRSLHWPLYWPTLPRFFTAKPVQN